jgi:hypothetical protein
MKAILDHLVVGARTLAEGVAYVSDLVGVAPQTGGRHEREGTHNALLSLGPEAYLEVISIDPDAEIPDHPRWFSLDANAVRDRLGKGPGLLTWVVRCAELDISRLPASHRGCELREMSRGNLRWRMTFTRDGALLNGGTLPLILQWLSPQRPTDVLSESGCRLQQLCAAPSFHQSVLAPLSALGLDQTLNSCAEDEFTGDGGTGDSVLRAVLSTPRGDVVLG